MMVIVRDGVPTASHSRLYPDFEFGVRELTLMDRIKDQWFRFVNKTPKHYKTHYGVCLFVWGHIAVPCEMGFSIMIDDAYMVVITPDGREVTISNDGYAIVESLKYLRHIYPDPLWGQ